MSNPCQRQTATEDGHNDVPDDRVILFLLTKGVVNICFGPLTGGKGISLKNVF